MRFSEIRVKRIRVNQGLGVYRNRKGSHFYGTEYDIWADIGPVGNTEKKIGL